MANFQTYNKKHIDETLVAGATFERVSVPSAEQSTVSSRVNLKLVGTTVGSTDPTVIVNTNLDNIVFPEASQSLTNKTIDADSNTISNIETENFKSGVLQTTVRASSSATDTTIASEKAVRNALDDKVDTMSDEFTTATKVGNLPSGYDISNKKLVEILQIMLGGQVQLDLELYDENNTKISTFIIEQGKTVKLSKIICKHTKGASNLSKLTLKIGSDTLYNEITPQGNSTTYDFQTIRQISSNETIQLIVTDEKGIQTTKNQSFTFRLPTYYGTEKNKVDGDIRTLTKGLFGTKSASSLRFRTSQTTPGLVVDSVIYAYPQTWGNLTDILDWNQYHNLDSFELTTSTISINGTDVLYNIYTQKIPTTTEPGQEVTYSFI